MELIHALRSANVLDHCLVFHQDSCVELETLNQDPGLASGFVWLSLHEPSEEQMLQVAEIFGVHHLIVEDACSAHQRPKVERYDDQLFIVVRSVKYADFEKRNSVVSSRQVIETGEMQFVVGKHFIITIRHNTALPNLGKRLDPESHFHEHGPMAITWAVADALVDNYVHVARELSDDVDALEEEVFTPQAVINVDQIYLLKREILEMRHAIDPLDPALRLMIADNKDLLSKPLRSYFRDVLDHEILVKDEIASFDERLSSLIDAAVAKISIQQNNDMRTISAWVGMAAVPTLVAGIYGMNFDNMPELHSHYGYYVVLAIIGVMVAIMWWWFRKKNWL